VLNSNFSSASTSVVSGIRRGVARKPYLKFSVFEGKPPQKTLFISMKKKEKEKKLKKQNEFLYCFLTSV
jgi:hypothetical protein